MDAKDTCATVGEAAELLPRVFECDIMNYLYWQLNVYRRAGPQSHKDAVRLSVLNGRWIGCWWWSRWCPQAGAIDAPYFFFFFLNNLVGAGHEGAGNKTLGTSPSIEINGNGNVLMNYSRTHVGVSNQLALTSRLPRPLQPANPALKRHEWSLKEQKLMAWLIGNKFIISRQTTLIGRMGRESLYSFLAKLIKIRHGLHYVRNQKEKSFPMRKIEKV